MPAWIAFEARPAPLAPMAVPVAHREIEETRRQELVHVDSRRGIGLEPAIELLVVDDFFHAERAQTIARRRRGIFTEESDRSLEVVTELAQHGIVGKRDERPRLRADAGSAGQAPRDQFPRGVLRRHLVLEDALDDSAPKPLVNETRDILRDAAEGIAAAVRACERERLGLPSPDAPHG